MMKKLLAVALIFVLHVQATNQSFMNIQSIEDVCNLFPKTVEEIEARVEAALEDARQRIHAIEIIAFKERNFENTVQAIDYLEGYSPLFVATVTIKQLNMLSPDKFIVDAAYTALLILKRFAVDHIANNNVLYRALCEYVEYGMCNEQLTTDQYYFIEERLKTYHLAGLDLSEEKQEVVRVLKRDLVELTTEFDANIAHDVTKLLLRSDDLVGVDEDFLNGLEFDQEGNKILTMAYPTVNAVLQNCCIADTRKKMFISFNQRAYPENKELLSKIIIKRDQLAKELGFAHYADLDLAQQMVTTAAQAERFVNDLFIKVKSKIKNEFKKLMEFLPDSVKLTDAGKLLPWDFAYLYNVHKKKHFSVDEEKIAEYFPMEKTIAGLLSIYEQFFGLKFMQVPVQGLWHDSVTGLSVIDADSGQLLGYFLLDLYPRENKYSHACHEDIVYAIYNADGTCNQAASMIIANLPQSTPEKPSLLKRSSLVTFFHEFGHALHALLGRTKMALFSGTQGKWDFLEVPSLMLEEWLGDKYILQSLSSHYQTGEKLSDDQIAELIALKNFDDNFSTLRRIFFSLLSLDYFKSGLADNPQMLMKKMHDLTKSMIEFSFEDHMYASFVHLTSYGPKYYSYLWSHVLALDVFDTIKKEGLLNPVVGKRYVEQVIGRGGEVDPNILLENFLGRKPNQEAFLRDLGL